MKDGKSLRHSTASGPLIPTTCHSPALPSDRLISLSMFVFVFSFTPIAFALLSSSLVSAHLLSPHLRPMAHPFRYALSRPRRSITKNYEPHLPSHSISDVLYHTSTTIPPVIYQPIVPPLMCRLVPIASHFYMYVSQILLCPIF